MLGAARVGDAVSHGGVICTGSPDVFVNALCAARVSSVTSCALHGASAVVTGSSSVFVNGLPMSRMGDLAGCGAVIVTGSCDVFVG